MATLTELAAEASVLNDEDFAVELLGPDDPFWSTPDLFEPWFQGRRAITLAVIARQTSLVRPGDEELVARGDALLERARTPLGLMGGGLSGRRRKPVALTFETPTEERDVGILGAVQGISDVAQALAPGIEAGVQAALAVQQVIGGPQQPFVAPGGGLTLPQISALQVQQAGLPLLLGSGLAGLGGSLLGQGSLGGLATGLAETLLPKGLEAAFGLGGTQFFKPNIGGFRARHTIEADNPITGKRSFWVNRGRPMLWSGDLGACKRVARAASKARRRRPR